mmetsp:Transcript_1539/g.5585  ORF Transcript_1539/g.5585 Transcript_1539/m.5585 type:complete len:87 (-) Transcript_1539:2899-3159(-)
MWSPMGESVPSMCLNELLYMCDALDGNAPCGFVTEIIKARDVGVAERVGGTDAEKRELGGSRDRFGDGVEIVRVFKRVVVVIVVTL